MNTPTLFLLLVTSIALSACGGGGKGKSSIPATSSAVTSSSAVSSNGLANSSGAANSNSAVSLNSAASSSLAVLVFLPKIEINSGNNVIVNEPKVDVTMKVTEYDANNLATVTYDGFAGAEYRGSSSQFFNQLFDVNGDPTGIFKKSLGIETRDSSGAGIDATLLGFPAEEDWVLLAPFSDKTLMRDTLIYSLAREMDGYASRWKYFELYLNDEYKGIYILLEKIKRDPQRLNISNLKAVDNEGEELTGGYIIKIDKTSGEDLANPEVENVYLDSFSFVSEQVDDAFNNKHHFIYSEPKSEDITEPQKAYIQNYVHEFEAALASENFKDEVTGYRNYIDVDSFIDYFILNELSRNVDGFNLSLYLVKDKNKKLALGPVWDFNLAFGNAGWCGAERTYGWAYNHAVECPGVTAFPVPFWWDKLLTDPYFVNKLKARWASLRITTLANAALATKVDTTATQLKSTTALTQNFQTWPILTILVWPNQNIWNTYDGEVNQLKTWLNARTTWLDQQFQAM